MSKIVDHLSFELKREKPDLISTDLGIVGVSVVIEIREKDDVAVMSEMKKGP